MIFTLFYIFQYIHILEKNIYKCSAHWIFANTTLKTALKPIGMTLSKSKEQHSILWIYQFIYLLNCWCLLGSSHFIMSLDNASANIQVWFDEHMCLFLLGKYVREGLLNHQDNNACPVLTNNMLQSSYADLHFHRQVWLLYIFTNTWTFGVFTSVSFWWVYRSSYFFIDTV